MTKRLIEIDDALLESARAALGTSGITDTVVAALKCSVDEEGMAEREAHIARLGLQFAEAGHDLLDEKIMADAWKIG